MVLQDADGDFLYIHRMLYDNAVILEDRYNGDYKKLAEDISPTGDIPSERIDVDYFYRNAPAPVNILAPFLLLCNGTFNNYDDMCGALHVMSNTFNFKKLPEIPKEVRLNAMQFSMSIKEEYRLSWDLFFSKCVPYSDDLILQRGSTPTQTSSYSAPASAPAPATSSAPASAPAPEDVETMTIVNADGTKVDVDLDMSFLKNLSSMDDFLPADDKKKEEKAPTPAPEPEKPKATGMDFLKSMK